jgi:hypothetical protein
MMTELGGEEFMMMEEAARHKGFPKKEREGIGRLRK